MLIGVVGAYVVREFAPAPAGETPPGPWEPLLPEPAAVPEPPATAPGDVCGPTVTPDPLAAATVEELDGLESPPPSADAGKLETAGSEEGLTDGLDGKAAGPPAGGAVDVALGPPGRGPRGAVGGFVGLFA
jgi:hypothetical protein